MFKTTKNKLAIGFGYFVVFVVSHGIGVLAIPYYQMVLGIDPFALATILTIPVLLSAFASAKIGEYVGRAATATNGRKGVVMLSGWVCAISYGAIWSVPDAWSTNTKVIYLLLTAIVFYISATFLSIAIRCFAYEETADSSELTSVMGFTAVFDKIGSIFYYWMFPLAQSSLFSSLSQGIKVVGWSISIVFIGVLANLVALYANAAQSKSTALKHHATVVMQLPGSYWPILKPLLWITFIQTGLVGICISMDFYVLVYYVAQGNIQSGALWKGVLSTSFALIGLVSIPILVYAAGKVGKQNILIIVLCINCLNAILKWFIFQPGREYLLILDALTGVWVWTAMITIIPSMLADICYWVKRETHCMPDSYVVAKHNWALNMGTVVAILGSGIVLNAIGFDAAQGAFQPLQTLDMMRIILSGGSLFFSMLSIILLMRLTFHPR